MQATLAAVFSCALCRFLCLKKKKHLLEDLILLEKEKIRELTMKLICNYFKKYVKDITGSGKYALEIGTGSANMALSLSEMGVRCIPKEEA